MRLFARTGGGPMTHRFLPTQQVPRTRPKPDPEPEPTLLDRAIARAGSDFPSVGTFVYAAMVSAA